MDDTRLSMRGGLQYIPPTPSEVRTLLAALGLTGGQAALLMGLSDGRQVRKYTGGDQPRRMPFAALYALIHRSTGRAVSPEGWRGDIGDLLG
jgi:hypothetical protein